MVATRPRTRAETIQTIIFSFLTKASFTERFLYESKSIWHEQASGTGLQVEGNEGFGLPSDADLGPESIKTGFGRSEGKGEGALV